jgi:hypothetical protein
MFYIGKHILILTQQEGSKIGMEEVIFRALFPCWERIPLLQREERMRKFPWGKKG